MNVLLIPIFILLTVYGFLRKREYVLAFILVGQPFLKLMLIPFSNNINRNIILLFYFSIGFYCLCLIRFMNKRTLKLDNLTKKHLILYLLFCLIALISLIYLPNKNYGVNKFVEFITTSFLIIFMSILTIDSNDSFYKTMNAIANIAIIVGIITVILVYLETGSILVRLSTTKATDIEIMGVNFAVSIWFGRRMGIGFFAMLFLTMLNRSKKNIFKTIILLILVILSISRGPIFSMIITFLLIVCLNVNRIYGYRKKYRKLLIITIICLNLLIVFIFINAESMISRLFSINDENVAERLAMYDFSIKLIRTNILGYGMGSFYYLSSGIHEYPHNILLEILFELGIQGVTIFVIGIIISIKRYYQLIRRYDNLYFNSYLNFSFSVLLFAILNAQFSGDIVSNEYVWFGLILISRCSGIINEFILFREEHLMTN